MHTRIFLLALGWRTHDPYERAVARAVRSYLVWLLVPVALSLVVFIGFGYALTKDIWLASVFTLCIASSAMFSSFLGTFQPGLSRGFADTLVLHVFQSGVVHSLSRKHGIKKMIPVFIADLKEKQAYYQNCASSPLILVDKELALNCSNRSLSGIVCHEVGHAVLPLGIKFFAYVTITQRAFFDKLVHYATLRQLNRLLLSERYEQTFGWSKEQAERILPPHLWGLVSRIFWIFSSYPGNYRREYACDAISALLLRDVVPLIAGLRIITDAEPELLIGFSTHPSPKKRIAALLAIDAAAANTH